MSGGKEDTSLPPLSVENLSFTPTQKVIVPESSEESKENFGLPAKKTTGGTLSVPPLAASSSEHNSSNSFDLLENEDEERLLGEAGPLPPIDGVYTERSPNVSRKAIKAMTSPTLRSVSLPKGPEAASTSPGQLGRAVSAQSVASNGAPCTLDHTASVAGSMDKKAKKVVSDYYKKQNELLESFKNDSEQIQEFQKIRTRQRLQSSTSVDPTAEEEKEQPPTAPLLKAGDGDEDIDESKKSTSLVTVEKGASDTASEIRKKESNAASTFAAITLAVNVSLMLAKAVASYLSGSLSIISSLVDSAVDIMSGLVIYLTSRAIRKRDPYLYPRGRTRLEPLGLIIISVVMGICSIQLIANSVERIVNGHSEVDLGWPSVGIMIATVCIKLTLVIICRNFKNDPSIVVLAQDHRNDCISNTVALFCAYASEKIWTYFDPIGAILVSVYIAATWFGTGYEHIVMLSGKSAEPEFINRIIKVCIDHDPRIEHIDTVYVYHYGMKFLVEVHIVLDENMTLKVTHDISESLQINIESLPEVERAFVHTDYEFEHQPQDEHKIV